MMCVNAADMLEKAKAMSERAAKMREHVTAARAVMATQSPSAQLDGTRDSVRQLCGLHRLWNVHAVTGRE